MLRLFVFVLFFSPSLCSSKGSTVSVLFDSKSKSYAVKDGEVSGAVSIAHYSNEINQTGWSHLEVSTNANYTNSQQAYAAGLAEGYISRDLIAMFWTNTAAGICPQPLSGFCKKLQKYLDENLEWMKKQMKVNGDKDPYWHQVGLFMDQSSGLVDGYVGKGMKGPVHSVDISTLFMLQIGGDVEDLSEALGNPGHQRVMGSGRCSALVKLLHGNADVYIAQDTWNGFESMLRVLKKYDFSFTSLPGGSIIPGSKMTFSSYPGFLTSGDDFYVISSGLVAQETTIGNSNPALWKNVKPTGAVLEGIRSMVANRLAKSGKQWTSMFKEFNSGTYNNQWMILDYKLFNPGMSTEAGLLWVLEQIPGMIKAQDQTDLLKLQTYWPSYNTAFYDTIFNSSGGQEMVKKYGDWFTYDKTPRANIFRRDQDKINSTDSMIKMMRYNNFQHDPLSKCNCTPGYSGENAISARSDLNPINGTYPFGALGHRAHGGTDMKMTTSALAKTLDFVAVSSPTYDQQTPFQWSKSDFDKKLSHVGHPDKWDFKPIQTKWSWWKEGREI